MRSLLFCLPVFAAFSLSAQTYFYIGSMEVTPAAPTTMDPLTLHIHGDLSSTGSHISNVHVMVEGTTVHVTISAGSGPGNDVLVPHTEEVQLGTLAEGTYLVHIMGPNVLDSAPEQDHLFTVMASTGGSPCESLDITSIRYNAFADTMITVRVSNASNEIFSYPGFILLNIAGDTVAMETTTAFGISQSSIHHLKIHDDIDLTLSSFSGTLQLWTLFYSELACSFPVEVELCPPPECAIIIPYVVNQGGAMTLGTFLYEILGTGGIVASGEIILDDEHQFAGDTICLPPGNYTMHITSDATSGQPWAGVTTMGDFSGPQVPVPGISPFPPPQLEFTFYEQCVPIIEHVLDAPDEVLLFLQTRDEILIYSPDGVMFQGAMLYDVRGAVIASIGKTGQDLRVPVTGLAPGLYILEVLTPEHPRMVRKFMVGH